MKKSKSDQLAQTFKIVTAPILDACCGGKMMYFDKHDDRILSQDIRKVRRHKIASNGSYFGVEPDVVGDFTRMQFRDNRFNLVIFDPPHLRCGKTSFMYYKYGSLDANWQETIRRGFSECFRVLKPCGVLIFKWCDSFKPLKDVLALTTYKPLFSHKTISRSGSKHTYFVVFFKDHD